MMTGECENYPHAEWIEFFIERSGAGQDDFALGTVLLFFGFRTASFNCLPIVSAPFSLFWVSFFEICLLSWHITPAKQIAATATAIKYACFIAVFIGKISGIANCMEEVCGLDATAPLLNTAKSSLYL